MNGGKNINHYFMKNLFLFFAFVLAFSQLPAQQITYSQPESADLVRSLNFEILGKMGGQFLVYKNISDKHYLSVYNDQMQLIDNTDLMFMDDKVLNVDFIVYPDFAWMVYQYQKKNILHCTAVKINSNGKLLTNPVDIDTTEISYWADNKIYSMVNSDDKSKIMVYKVQKVNDKYNFTTLLLNDSLQLLRRSFIPTDIENKKNVLSSIVLTNDGELAFTKGDRPNARNLITHLSLLTKAPNQDSFRVTPINLNGKFIDDVKIKVDNINHTYVMNTFYYDSKRGDVVGLFMPKVDAKTNEIISLHFVELGDQIRSVAKSDGSNKAGLNDFFIKDIVLKKDGGYLMTAEDYYTQSKSSPWDRYDYLYGSPYYYSPYYYDNYYYSPWGYGRYFGNRFYDRSSQVRYYYNNLLVFSIKPDGTMDWVNVIHKSQYDDDKDNYLSYAQVLTGGQIHFLFNELERRKQLISDQSINAKGDINRNPPLRSLDKGYEFMPRYAKQVSATEVIIPCIYRNYICFAKVEY